MTDSISPFRDRNINPLAPVEKILQSLPVAPKVQDMEEVRQRKIELAQHLKEVTVNYDKFIPFSKKLGLVDSIIYTFKKFIRQVLRLPPPLPLSELELRFTIHLFRNFDKNPLDLAYRMKGSATKGLEHQIPFSQVLNTWHHFLSSLEQFPSFQKDVDLKALKKCVKMQEQIESARQSIKPSRLRKVKHLAEELKKEIRELKVGAKLYIPGGALEPTSLEEVQMHQMLYEVTRSEADPEMLRFKIIHTSPGFKKEGPEGMFSAIEAVLNPQQENKSKDNPVEEFEVASWLLAAEIETLVTVQTASVPKLENMGVFEKFDFLKGGGDLATLGNTGLSELKGVLKEFKKHEPPEEGYRTHFKAKSDPEKVYETYLKTFLGNSAKEEKMLLKTALFLHLYEKGKDHLSDPRWNKWLKDNAVNLLRTLEKRTALPDDEMSEDLREVFIKFQGIVEELDRTMKVGEKRSLPAPPDEQPLASISFKDPVVQKDPLIPMEKVHSLKKVSGVQVPELQAVDFSSPENALLGVQEWVKEIKKLSKAKKLGIEQELVSMALNSLKPEFFDQIPPTDAEKWNGLINQLLRFQIQTFFGLQNPSPTPHMLLTLLKTLEITQKLALLSGTEGGFEGYALDMTYYKEMLKDPYLDLGHLGPEVIQTIVNIEKVSEKRLRLTEIDPAKMSNDDATFYQEFIKAHPDLKIPPDTLFGVDITNKGVPQHLSGDYGTLKFLPAQVVYVKQAIVMSQMLFAKYRTLHYWGAGKQLGTIFAGTLDPERDLSGTKEQKKASQDKAIKRQGLKQVDAYFNNQEAPQSFEFVKSDWVVGGLQGMVQIEPYGVRFHDYAKQQINSPMYAKGNVPMRNNEVVLRVLEGVVSNDEPKEIEDEKKKKKIEACEDNGKLFLDHPHIHRASGQVATERKILLEKKSMAGLPLDVSAELQLMQSSPEETRIPLTLGVFIRHPALLSDPKLGRDLQRVFRLNLFRNGAIFRKLAKEPEYQQAFLRDLQRLMSAAQGSQDISTILFLMGVFEDIPAAQNIKAQNFTTLKNFFNKAEKEPALFPFRRQIYQALLLHYTKDAKYDFEIILKAFFALQKLPPTADEVNPTADEAIQTLTRNCKPGFQELLEDPDKRNHIFQSILHQDLRFTPSPHYPIFKADNFEIDVKRGRVYENQKTSANLPSKITQDPLCLKLFSDSHIFNIQTIQSDVKVGQEVGEQYDFEFKGTTYRIVSLESKPPQVYRQGEKGWQQVRILNSILDPTALNFMKESKGPLEPKKAIEGVIEMAELQKRTKKDLPKLLTGAPCWIDPDGKAFTIESVDGTPLFAGVLDAKISSRYQKGQGHLLSLKHLWDVRGGKKLQILNPWKEKGFAIFKGLDDENQILMTGKNRRVSKVNYERLGLEYQWDNKSKQWQCENFKGYFLSTQPVEALFSSTFKDYHLLEHPSKPSKLIITQNQYETRKVEGTTPHLLKYTKDLNQRISATETPPHYVFEVDPLQGLKAESPEGYLYLSYLLYTQGKYAQSVFYMRKAADIKVGKSKEGDKILNWFKDWKDSSLNAKAVLLHLGCIELEHKKEDLTSLFLNYEEGMTAGKIDSALLLTPYQKEKVVLKGLSGTMQQILQFNEVELIDSEIEVLRQKIAVNKASEKGEAPKVFPEASVPIFSAEIRGFLEAMPEGGSVPKEVVQDLEKAFKVGEKVSKEDQFKQELGTELIADFKEAINQKHSQVQFKETTDFKALFSRLKEEQSNIAQRASQTKMAILDLMHIEVQDKGFEGLARQLEEFDLLKERYLEEALFCAASHDWSGLIESKIIKEAQIPKLTVLVGKYLVEATESAQFEKALDPEISLEALADLLGARRHFDVEKDPYTFPTLLIEYFTKNIARLSQVQNVRDMLKEQNVFKHEALAGGKTTMLRNIISKIKADGRVLSGVMTHEPLVGMHHPLYEKTTREAYGEKAYRLSFQRNDPSDVNALKRIYRDLLEMMVQKARISITRSDALSLHNLLLQKYDELWKGKGDPDVKNQEIDVLSSILEVLANDTVIGNDELEKITSPDSENNYTAGESKGRVNEIKCAAGLKIVEWILSDEIYKPIFQKNQHSKISEDLFTQFRVDMALKAQQEFLPNVDSDHFVQYMTGVVRNPKKALNFVEMTQFYEKHIKQKGILAALHKLLNQVVKNSYLKEGGDRFKRDSDGMEVKPAEDGDLKARSEFGSEEETIWYTCLNYMDQSSEAGVQVDQIVRLVGIYKNKASQEILRQQQNDPLHSLDFVNTSAYLEFSEKFGVTLHEATPEACALIAKKLNGDPKLLVEFLRDDIFPRLIVSSEKIVANSQDLAAMFKEFYGSSGTSNNNRALPDPIKKDPNLVKQKGVDGAVLATLYQVFEPGDMILFESKKDLKAQVAKNLQKEPASTLIDLGPMFPGKSSRAIHAELKPFLTSGTKVRTLNEQNEVQIEPMTTNVEEMLTILAKANGRGTNLVMGKKSIGYVTIGPKTNATDFFQAVMRMRKLGQGQRVKYLLDPALEPILGKNPSLGELIAFLYGNEAEGLKNSSHMKSEKQKAAAVGKCELFKQLHHIKDRNLRMKASQFRSFFFKPSQESLESCGIPKELKPTPEVITNLAKEEKKKLEELLLKFEPPVIPDIRKQLEDKIPKGYRAFLERFISPELKKELIKIKKQPPVVLSEEQASVVKGIKSAILRLDQKIKGDGRISPQYLPDLTTVSSFDLDLEQEVEKEQEQEQEMEVEQMQEVTQELQSGIVPPGYAWKPLDVISRENLIDQTLKDPDKIKPLNDTVEAYDPNVFLTTNLYRQDTPWGAEGSSDKVKGQDVMLRTTFLIDRRSPDVPIYTVFGAIKDYDHELQALDNPDVGSKEIDVYHLNMLTGEFDGRKAKVDDYPLAIQEKLVRAIVQAKLFAGQVDLISPSDDAPLLRKETEAFEAWLKTLIPTYVTQLESNLKKYLSEYKPSVASQYGKSEMAKVFRKLRA